MVRLPDVAQPFGAISDVPGIHVGQTERAGDGWLTGVTVVIPPAGSIGAVDVRGGGPGTRETDALAPGTAVDTVDAIALSGGSAYGLAAATGIQHWCEEQGRGFPIKPGIVVPIVPAAIVFDLGKGGDPSARPDAEMGYEAASAATSGEVRRGTVGAGTGTTLGRAGLKGGVGTASIELPGGVVVGALAVVNAFGSPCVPGSARLLASPFVTEDALRPLTPDPDVEPLRDAPSQLNTTLAVVATNAELPQPQVRRMATAGHDGMARALRPVHTLLDGDSVFGLATGDVDVAGASLPGFDGAEKVGGTAAVQAAAADAVTLAILDGILAATGAAELPSYLERYPSARPPAW